MKEYYQIPAIPKNHPDADKWERLNFALRRIFDQLASIQQKAEKALPEDYLDSKAFRDRINAIIGLPTPYDPIERPAIVEGLPNDEDVPSPPNIAVTCERLLDGTYVYTVGAEIPESNANYAYETEFQISKNNTFTQVVIDKILGVPDNFQWRTAETLTWYFRARTKNLIGWSAWSSVVSRGAEDALIGNPDNSYPSAPQVIVLTDDDDESINGNELKVIWTGPSDNWHTIFSYSVQVHTSNIFPEKIQHIAGIVDQGDTTKLKFGDTSLVDSNKTFSSELIGKTIWFHSGDYSEHSLRSTAKVTSVPDSHTVVFDKGCRMDPVKEDIYWEIITPTWELVFISRDCPTKLISSQGAIVGNEDTMHYTFTSLPPGTYWVRVAAANAFGIGDWSDPTPTAGATIDGLKADDIKRGTVIKDLGVPSAPVLSVRVGRTPDGVYHYAIGAERPSSNYASAYATYFEIARDASFNDVIFYTTGGVPHNFIWTTPEIGRFYFRAQVANSEGWGAWSDTVTKAIEDSVEGFDTGVASAPQNVVAYDADVDETVPGNELVVEWDRPATNALTIHTYHIQVHHSPSFPSVQVAYSGSGSIGKNPPEAKFYNQLTDNSTSFSNVVGKYLWLYSSYPPSNDNAIFGGVIVASTQHTVTVDKPMPGLTTSVTYQILTPENAQVDYEGTEPTSILQPTLQDDSHFKHVVRHLPPGTYYVRVRGDNIKGAGAYGYASGPVTVHGILAKDIDDSVQIAEADTDLPGAPVNFTVSGASGKFIADWDLPSTNINTWDDVCIQYATDQNFTQNVVTAPDWGPVKHLEGYDPGKSYYFRLALHNKSGVASNPTVKAAIQATGRSGDYVDYGWGPFCSRTNLISSSNVPDSGLSSTTQQGVSRANTGLDSNGRITQDIPSTIRLDTRSASMGTMLSRINDSGKLLTADDVANDGTTYYRMTGNHRTGATRAYNGLDDSGKITQDIPSTRKVEGRSEAIGTTLSRLTPYGTLGSTGDIDSEGYNRRFVTEDEKTGAGRGYSGLNSSGQITQDIPSSIRVYGRNASLYSNIARLTEDGYLYSADDVKYDGTTYHRMDYNHKLGAGRAYDGLDTDGTIKKDIPSSIGVVGRTSLGTLVQHLNNSGQLDSTANIVTDVTNKRLVTDNQQTGAGLAFGAIGNDGVVIADVNGGSHVKDGGSEPTLASLVNTATEAYSQASDAYSLAYDPDRGIDAIWYRLAE